MNISVGLLKKLPKVELHCHLDGSLNPKTIIDLAEKQKINLPTTNLDELKSILSIGDKRVFLEEYLEKFKVTLSVLQTPESLERTSFELIQEVAKENVRYIEVRYSPILHTEKGMTPEESVDAVLKGLKAGKEEFGVRSGIIICGIRNINPKISLQLAELTYSYKNKGVVILQDSFIF